MAVMRLQQSEVSEELAKVLADNRAHKFNPECDLPGCKELFDFTEEIDLEVVEEGGRVAPRQPFLFCSQAHTDEAIRRWGLKI